MRTSLAWLCCSLVAISAIGCSGSNSNPNSNSNSNQVPGEILPGSPGKVGGCNVFTADDDWNIDISGLTADAALTAQVQSFVGNVNIHPDYGGGSDPYGIPINVVPEAQPMVAISFDQYADESDPSPYPFPGPDTAKIEGGTPTSCSGDCHVLVVHEGACMLYEGYACQYQTDGWHCGNGAKWDLSKLSYGQRPEGWTSADAAGLPIMPGLVRYDEVAGGELPHAIRFTMRCTLDSAVRPATHVAGSASCGSGLAMGSRVRLKADYDISTFPERAQVVARAMKKHGMILADNGSNFYFTGEANTNWTDDEDISPLKAIPASAFEVVVTP